MVSRGTHSKGVCRLVCESFPYTQSFFLLLRGTRHHTNRKVSVHARLENTTIQEIG